jgi:phenylacetate-CoA ligase
MAAPIRPAAAPAAQRHCIPNCETMPREQLRALQLRRLRDTVEKPYANVRRFGAAWKRAACAGSTCARGRRRLLPFTVKTTCATTIPFGLFARPLEQLARLHASRAPRQVHRRRLHRQDLDQWADLMARSMYARRRAPGRRRAQRLRLRPVHRRAGAHYGASAWAPSWCRCRAAAPSGRSR